MTATRNRTLPLAIGLATATTFLTYRFLQTATQLPFRPATPATQIKVAVPVADVPPLRPLKASMFASRQLPAEGLPGDAVADPAALEGQVSLTALRAGRPVAQSDVAPRTPQLGMAFTVRPPRRAVTVALDPVIGVAGFPKPGNRVDVLASFNTNAGMVTRTVLQDVEILALGADVQPVSGKAEGDEKGEPRAQPNATLAVLPGEAERLILAETRGKLRLALRAVDDTARGKSGGVSEVQLTGVPILNKANEQPAPKPAPAFKPVAQQPPSRPTPAPAARKVLVVRGSSHEVVQIGRSGSQPTGSADSPPPSSAAPPAGPTDSPQQPAAAETAKTETSSDPTPAPAPVGVVDRTQEEGGTR